jgi:hypothetical protein
VNKTGDISQDLTTTPPTRGMTPLSVVVVGLAQSWVGFRLSFMGTRQQPSSNPVADNIDNTGSNQKNDRDATRETPHLQGETLSNPP